MKYAIFDERGLPQGFYTPEIHGDNIPKEAIEITEEQWQEFINNQGRRAYINGQIIDITDKKWDDSKKKWVTIPEIDKVKEIVPNLISQYDTYNRQIIEKHYPLLKLQGFMQMSISLQMQLNNPDLTDDEKTAIQDKLDKINSVNDWIHNCTALYYKYEVLFNQVTTLDELESLKQQIEAEYEEIEEQDPKITYKDLL